MSNWFQKHPPDAEVSPAQRVFITGGAGRVGRVLAEDLHHDHALTLMAHPNEDTDAVESFGEIVRADLAERDRLAQLMQGHDTLIHLAGNARPTSPWEKLLAPNILGAQHAFAAAAEAGVQRIIFASSVHAVLAAPPHQRPVHPGQLTCPGNYYGATKCFGEALGRSLFYQHGITFFAVRIGAFLHDGRIPRSMSGPPTTALLSARDGAQLFRLCVQNTSLRFAIVHAQSRNDQNFMDIEPMRELLGYEPADDYRTPARR